MAATYDLATDIGKVRLLIDDTDIADAHFTDEEITAFLTMASDSVNLAAAIALESWASSLSETAESETIGDYKYVKKLIANKLALAQRYRENSSNEPDIDWSSFNFTDEEE